MRPSRLDPHSRSLSRSRPAPPDLRRTGRVAGTALLLVLAAGLGLAAGLIWRRPLLGLLGQTSAPGAMAPGMHGDGQETPTVYYCPMHPSYRSDHPGDCPVCNMRMIPLGETAAEVTVEGRATLSLTAERRQRIGVVTEPVQHGSFIRTLRAAGTVEADERGLSAVSLKVGGWIEALHVPTVGEPVEVGQPLFSLYSPELYEAQREYLLALELARRGTPETGSFGERNVASARTRLELWDMTAAQIQELEDAAEPRRTTEYLARSAGLVTRREIVQGARVEPGSTLLELADLSHVWVLADLYEPELALVQVDTPALLAFDALPGRKSLARVSYIYPQLDERTRTCRVRFELDNPDGFLRPGMYVTVSLQIDLGQQLSVSDGAVLDTGTRQLVFVDLGEGHLEPREVEIGTRSDGRAQVLSGLEAGEQVVSRGTFLVDSESRLQAALAQHAGGGGHAH